MGTALAIIFLGIPIVLVLTLGGFAYWLLADTSAPDTRGQSGPQRVSVFGRLMRWARRPVPKLFYRRDGKGRFRKVWRG